MRSDDANPERTPASGPDIAQEIRDSFQAVLDALDAARADLLREEQLKRVESPPQPKSRHGHPAEDARCPQPTPSSAPASSTSGRALPVRRLSSVTQPERPEPHRSTAAEPLRTGGLHQADTPRAAVPEPPALPRGLQAVPPPLRGKPPWTGGPGPEAVAPTMDFASPAPWPESGRSGSPRPGRTRGRRRRLTSRRHLQVSGVLGLGAASGLILAAWLLTDRNAEPATSSSLPGHMQAPLSPAPKDPPPAAPGQTDRPQPSTPDPPLPEIPGTGVLRQGDSGHGVYELQVRLRQIPDIYDGGAIDGRYDAEVGAAVALFQKRYGVRGDESGVYGDNTRFALMLRTK